jgi:uroporphyrinogen III methyltransferase/synthase
LLTGKKIVVTRPVGQEKSIIDLLHRSGATAYHCPMIQTSPCYDTEEMQNLFKSIQRFDWICFTSANGVKFALDFAEKENKLDFFHKIPIACIGPATQEALSVRGIKSSLIPEKFQAEGMISAFQSLPIKGKSILLLRAKGARKILSEALEANGAFALEFPIYDTFSDPIGMEQLKNLLKTGSVDVIAFTSSSTVRSFKKLLLEEKISVSEEKLTIASIGPITSETLRDEGLWVNVEAQTSTAKGLVESLEEFFNS